jgi:hypothetical protein
MTHSLDQLGGLELGGGSAYIGVAILKILKRFSRTATAFYVRTLDDMDLLPTVIVGTWCLADDISDALRYRRCEVRPLPRTACANFNDQT